jgi:hypothetical protein
VGFRNQFEFDRKRVLVGTESKFCIYSYDIDEQPQELINTSVSKNELIQFIGFIDDERPQFVLLITKHKLKEKSFVRLLKIKKETDIDSMLEGI